MPFLLLLLLAIPLLFDDFPPPFWEAPFAASPSLAITLTWSGVFMLVAAAFLLTRWVCWQLRRYPDERERVLRQFATWRFYHLVGLFLLYGASLYGLGWGWAVQEFCAWEPHDAHGGVALYPGADLLFLAPLFVGLLLSWACFYRAEQALHGTSASHLGRWAYVGYQLRQNLALVIAPLALMIVSKALLRSLPDDDFLGTTVAIGLPLAVFVTLPWILRLVLKLKPLPAGPLRDRLLATSRRLHFRCSNILLWNTHGGTANAMVAGILPYPRYVLLTDRLLTDLTPDEVEAVFGHEVGHVKHAHMPFYVSFLVLSLVAVFALFQLVTTSVPWLHFLTAENQDWIKFPFLGIIAAYVFVVFGFLSRRCERQADVFGCRAVSCGRADCQCHESSTELLPDGRGLCSTGIRTFIQALEKVAQLNGISRKRPGWLQSWQHATIAHRVDFLQRMLEDPTLEPRFQRTVGRVKWGLLLGVLSVLLLLGFAWYWQSVPAKETQPSSRAVVAGAVWSRSAVDSVCC
jgi:Zn-dependent protease with chaperone function